MPKYAVAYKAGAWKTVIVEADDEADARDKADEEFDAPSLCHHCASNLDLSDWEPDDSADSVWETS